jgi:hypothetical protein
MSKAELAKGDFNNALKEVDRADTLAGHHFSPLLFIKGQILMGLKLYSNAVKEFESFLSQNKDDPATTAQVQRTIAHAQALADGQN